jgi:hypothetical protein
MCGRFLAVQLHTCAINQTPPPMSSLQSLFFGLFAKEKAGVVANRIRLARFKAVFDLLRDPKMPAEPLGLQISMSLTANEESLHE